MIVFIYLGERQRVCDRVTGITASDAEGLSVAGPTTIRKLSRPGWFEFEIDPKEVRQVEMRGDVGGKEIVRTILLGGEESLDGLELSEQHGH
jgi:hypothetical protein